MCGIAGWAAQVPGRREDLPDLAAMAAAMRHRGPDDYALQRLPFGGIAFRRLALIDLQTGSQPVPDEHDRYRTVFNGEIYNHRELHRELVERGHRLRGHGDAELLPHLFEEHGVEMFTRLAGMFALAVHDTRTGDVLLARDPFGIKPLYYARTPAGIVYASELATLLAGGAVAAEVDPRAVWHYLSFGYVPDPLSMCRGVQKVPPGHYVRFAGGEVSVHRYWQPRIAPGAGPAPSVAELREALEHSVRRHLVADVPVGSYLSGGVDSSLLAALAAREQPLHTFSIGFDGAAGELDELRLARETARLLGTTHHEQVVSGAEYRAALPEIVGSQDEPLADPSAPALWFLARAAAAEVKAVLSGEGADELFAGYPIYRSPAILRALAGAPAPARRAMGGLARRLPPGLKGRGLLTRAATPLEQRFLGNAPVVPDAIKATLLDREQVDLDALPASSEVVRGYYAECAGEADLVRMQTVSLQTWLPGDILAKADRMGMAHSLEVRVPYLDLEVFAAAARVPLDQRVAGRQTKVALRAVAEQLLPPATAARPKLGFPVPFRRWLDEQMRPLVRELTADRPASLLDPAGVRALFDGPQPPGGYRRQWAVLAYLLWERSFCSRGGA